jgi:hypothetical protein
VTRRGLLTCLVVGLLAIRLALLIAEVRAGWWPWSS